MSDVGGHHHAQELARGLSQTVTQALDESVSSRSMDGARQMAQTLSLRGLDRLLCAVAPYAHGPWPAPLRPVVERVQRAAAECARAGQVDVFRRMDDELGLMARAIERVPLARLSHSGAPGTETPAMESAAVPLTDALEGIPGERTDTELMKRVRLGSPVAGALRAALDWLVGGSPARMRMWLSSDGSALDVICEGVSYNGIQPAADVLSSVGAHLGPTGERPGAWTVRVPIRAERETFLMLEQDDLQLAVPWHAVVRVRLIPTDTIEMMLRRQALPVLPPLAASSRRMTEQPVTVVALGLKRACLVADRLVWRMSAEPTPVPGRPPAEGIRRAVQTDDGEVHWVLDPDFLLRGVAAPIMGQATPRPSAPPVTPSPVTDRPPAGRTPIPFPERPGTKPESTPDVAPLATLGSADVEPLGGPAVTPAVTDVSATSVVATEAPGAVEPPAVAAPPGAEPAPAAPVGAPRRALVAEDSIAARIYLARLLEQEGYDVHAVATAAALRESLAAGPWTLICADSGLAETPEGGSLGEMARAAALAGATLVALVRDAEDESAARAAGVNVTLRKPFERDVLERLLERHTPEIAGPSGSTPGGAGHEPDPDPREWGAR
jgi:CheY-like chemotaxis protein